MANNNLILRTLNSGFPTPFQDTTLGSVLSHADLDNNFIYLKSEIIYTATTSGTVVNFNKIGGNNFYLDLAPIIDSTDNYTTGATLYNNVAYFDRTDSLSAYTLDLSTVKFSGNTSGDCISDIWVSNIYPCSPLTIHGQIVQVNNIAIGDSSVAFGYYTVASGDYSHAEGKETNASGYYSHAEGSLTISSGIGSHAEGNSTTARGDFSHAGGSRTTAKGVGSFVHSNNSSANGDWSVILGGENITGYTPNTVYVPNFETRGSSVFNQDGDKFDFIVKSDNNTHLIFGDGTIDRVGINTSNPDSKFSISTTIGDGISFDGMTNATLVGKHKFYTKQAETNTSGVSSKTLAQIQLLAGERITLRGMITAIGPSNVVIGGTFSVVGYSTGTTPTIITPIDTNIKHNSIGSPTITITTGFNLVNIVVTGGGEATTVWATTYEYQIIS